MNRRHFLAATAGLLASAAILPRGLQASAGPFEITLTEAEWRARLTPAQFKVLRKEGTERPFTSPLNDETRAGIYHCAGCDLPVYPSTTKYDSGTGWPSFWAPLEEAIGTKADRKLIYLRTEVHCRRCGGHLGHVFDDGPQPTGKRHCLNGVALTFKPA
ncbi:peptide methionine sulfoxide reductase [Dinoroseobacter shibae DFL 12 = DSM 16493]|jgi:peptide-methionine (R)-S-oxide reductase|uniref:peptide-methionine (R)-S-oxide reductase n=1 Tax=Dinoroseobacter shibae (strain DSM 16493 / NCIMB 14021 / DFL 12) TaxID=398580 RepID=A8LIK1_DINSH|nr:MULTISPECIES: peptide-methionine (R)-S-oxide reductase MsrB [Dinoroseobacter]ABV94442.1 peptide methionine sulfoxide reductase [Dinoroseobacter shibae DFL 12 = DSM 16493]MDD9717595.1 peptide-methionine (R)-S-oxide reductase MsrB [Dinoroseobacter sp. PD6]URF45869.1 peptide-methionine (R)-S-oxide reductase MsrB [Dinoroseobacter shibae]URF50176.1 peptide-methionine (R)-S-oxide reductase MsrB [Dinoroseobacter shibae]